MLLEAADRVRDPVDVVDRQAEVDAAEELRAPAAVGGHADPRDPERGDHVLDVLDQRLVEDDDEHLVRGEALRVLIGEVGDPVERDGRLA